MQNTISESEWTPDQVRGDDFNAGRTPLPLKPRALIQPEQDIHVLHRRP